MHHTGTRRAALAVTSALICLLGLAACGGGAPASQSYSLSGSTGGSSPSSGGAADSVITFDVTGGWTGHQSYTIPAKDSLQQITGYYNTDTVKQFSFNFKVEAKQNPDHYFYLGIPNYTGPGSYALHQNTGVENLTIGTTLPGNGGVYWDLSDAQGGTCSVVVTDAKTLDNGHRTATGTFSCPSLAAPNLFGVAPLQVTNGTFKLEFVSL